MTDIAATLRDALADRYAIDREIGRGGMATVFLARDLRHDRQVALKVLDPELGAVLGVERFLSEIKVTANLQHPHLLPLFDSGAAAGLLFYVMPFVEGETLRNRIEREKQLPVDEVVRIASGVASALGYAHARGVIHRDLKPENILIQAGQPVVADFGIALAVSNAAGARMTQTGLSLGTPQYMSPEQASGDRALDARSDIYSLGAVTYEMLTGEPPHSGTTVQAVIAKLLTETPRGVRVTRPGIPEHVEAAVAKALEKLPADRFGSAERFVDALEGRGGVITPTGLRGSAPARVTRAQLTKLAPWALAGAASLLLIGWSLGNRAPRRGADATRVVRAQLSLPAQMPLDGMVLTPDGSQLVYVARTDGVNRLHVRDLSSLDSRVLEGTEGATEPFVSPAGGWVGFFSGNRMRKLPLAGGPVQDLAEVHGGSFRSASWGPRNEIVTRDETGLARVSASGGTATPLVDPATGKQVACIWPLVSPSGEHVFCLKGGPGGFEDDFLWVVSLRTGAITHATELATRDPHAVIDGHLVYRNFDASMMAVRFDARRGRIEGTPFPVLEESRIHALGGENAVYYSMQGLTRVVLAAGDSTRVLWTPPWPVSSPRISPDGRTLLAVRLGEQLYEIWTYDLATRSATRVVGRGRRPSWSTDGRRVTYIYPTLRGMQPDREVRSRVVDSSEPEVTLYRSDTLWLSGAEVSKDNTLVMVVAGTHAGIISKRLGDDSPARVVVENEGQVTQASVSPDGRWVAYTALEEGQSEVYVRPLGRPGGRLTISAGGGTEVAWDRRSLSLFYRNGDDFVRASLRESAGLEVVDRRVVARGRFRDSPVERNLDAAPDGQRLVLLSPVEGSERVVLVLNWIEEFRARVRQAQQR